MRVVKVGGSLFDWPELGPWLRDWLAAQDRLVVLVPGGGMTADAVRAFDRTHRLGEVSSHWLALRALALNARVLARLTRGVVVHEERGCRRRALPGRPAILDPLEFARRDERNPGRLPHHWQATSDSVAGRLAVVLGAAELVLLKSVPPPPGELAAWAAGGYVDTVLPGVLAGSGVAVRAMAPRQDAPRAR